METFVNLASFFCLALGAVFWIWGSAPLLRSSERQDSILLNLHTLSVSDTLGSMSILVGLLFQLPREWPLLLLALFSLAIWNTVLSYVLAYCYYAGRDVVDQYGVAPSGMAPSSLGPRCILPKNTEALTDTLGESNPDDTDPNARGRYV